MSSLTVDSYRKSLLVNVPVGFPLVREAVGLVLVAVAAVPEERRLFQV